MRIVFVVESHANYEGSEVSGVFRTFKEAAKKLPDGDWVTITRWDIKSQKTKVVYGSSTPIRRRK